jgi:hypothetical protein
MRLGLLFFSLTGEAVFPAFRLERGLSLQAAHSSHDGLRIPYREVRCPHRRWEAAGVKCQVSSPWYPCILVHW